jgi:hypothetical protein
MQALPRLVSNWHALRRPPLLHTLTGPSRWAAPRSLLMQAFEARPPPLREDADGILRVDGTRVTLESVVIAFDMGATAEEIVQREYVEHYHHERNHQGLDNVIPLPLGQSDPTPRTPRRRTGPPSAGGRIARPILFSDRTPSRVSSTSRGCSGMSSARTGRRWTAKWTASMDSMKKPAEGASSTGRFY